MRVFEAIAQCLADRKVTPLFGLIGDANLYMVDAFVRNHGGRYVAAAHEANAVLMALGHAQVTQGIGVATVTQGPGLTNTVSALIEGVKTRVPMVLLSGDTDQMDRDYLQNIDQRELIKATGAGFVQLRSPETVAEDIAFAFNQAAMEQCPVVLNMPINFQWQDAILSKIPSPPSRVPSFAPHSDELDNAVGIIAAARAPIILAGRGASDERQKAALIRLADRIGAPLATTLRGRELFAGEPYDLGIFGTLSSDPAMDAIAACDCLIAFGASLNRYTTYGGDLLKGKRIVQVDAQTAGVGRHHAPDAAIVGDPELVADQFVALLDMAEVPSSEFRNDDLAQRLSQWHLPPQYSAETPPGTVDIRETLLALNEAVPTDRVVVTDVGRFVPEAWKVFPVRRPHDFVYTLGFGAIGMGLGEAIGAAAADNGRTTVLVSGDGGFMLSGLAELSIAARYKLDLIVIICNDSNYGAEHIQYCNKQMDPELSTLPWPDLAPIATALGCTGVTIRAKDDVAAVADLIGKRNGPMLIDIKLHPDHIPPILH